MLITLKNNFLTVTADTIGAELQSIKSSDGTEYMWYGDKSYWGSHAPNLFPFVGTLRGNKAFCSNGVIYLPRHGLARHLEFSCEHFDSTSVTFCLSSNEETKRNYPYDFELRISFKLDGNTVTTVYDIKNTGDSSLPFCVGGHPAFNVPLSKDETYNDYIVEFEHPETESCAIIDPSSGLIDDSIRNSFLDGEKSFRLNHIIFRGDAIIFDTLKSRSVKLYGGKSGRGVKMDFYDMDYFAVWSPLRDAPFVCLEPWTGTATLVSEDDIFENKRGVTILEKGQSATYQFSITMF